MEHFIVPQGYHSELDLKATQGAIKHIKDHLERQLAKKIEWILSVSSSLRIAFISVYKPSP